MVSERQERKNLVVHFSSDLVDVIEIGVEHGSGSHGLECKKTKGYIMGEPAPDTIEEDATGIQEWMHYYSALTIRMRCAEHKFDRVNQQEARWRARSLRKKLDDPDDEAHLGLVLRKRTTDPSKKIPRGPCLGECQNNLRPFPRLTSVSSDASSIPRQTSASSNASPFPRETSASSDTSLSSRASMACRRWWHSCRAASRAIPMTKLFRQCPVDEIHFQDAAECMYCERIIDASFTTEENADISPRSPTSSRLTDENSDTSPSSSPSARLHRMLQWTKAKKFKQSQVLASFDPIIS
eukprot:TRINITY_DN5407_c1_g1_i3.p1 TRINITY_DN5407_c1_g1~~TRINITY_DN5407_c1_g1_i3.p1  ORF type:complete len:296 (+),score=20.72 TRINITY_DN5407_c1_g1_i3:64-951(+)